MSERLQEMDSISADAIQSVTGVWEEVLKKKGLKPSDDFFEVGGTSLLLVAAIDLIQRRLNARIDIGGLVGGATIEKLAAQVSASRAAAQSAE